MREMHCPFLNPGWLQVSDLGPHHPSATTSIPLRTQHCCSCTMDDDEALDTPASTLEELLSIDLLSATLELLPARGESKLRHSAHASQHKMLQQQSSLPPPAHLTTHRLLLCADLGAACCACQRWAETLAHPAAWKQAGRAEGLIWAETEGEAEARAAAQGGWKQMFRKERTLEKRWVHYGLQPRVIAQGHDHWVPSIRTLTQP